MFKKLMEKHVLEDVEKQFETPFGERLGKFLVVGLTGLIATYAAEQLYDRYVDRKNQTQEEGNTNAEA